MLINNIPAEVMDFIDQRTEYLELMRRADGDEHRLADYQCWSGHAQARGQLAAALNLTTPHELGETAQPIEPEEPARPSCPGYTGTLSGFLDWLAEHLHYGQVRLAENDTIDDLGTRRRRLETVTGGFSDDEHLLARVRTNMLGIVAWESSHRGGLDVYLIPSDHVENDLEMQWLRPEK